MAVQLECGVKQWGMLSWNKRWLTFGEGIIKVYKDDGGGSPPPGAQPIVAFDLTVPGSSVEPDPINAQRVKLDNGVALIHIKFDSAEIREQYTAAFAAAQDAASAGGAAAPKVAYDPSRYPIQLGKYWLGPIDPTRPHDDPGGGYGSVKAGINSETGERVCCKLSHEEYEGTEAQRIEIVLQAGLKHMGIVDLKDIVYEPPSRGSRTGRIRMIMELLSGGELFSEVVDNGGLSEDRARHYFRQILMGMAYCHGRRLVHRDIKLENLLLTADKQTVKIADFGLAKDVSENAASTVIGTAKYVAPEMLAGSQYDGFKSDIWSCGVCLYCMTECRFPFTKAGNDGVGGHGVHQTNASNLRLMQDLKRAQYVLKPGRSPEYVEFLSRLLCPDVGRRYTAADALMDPWILNDPVKPWTPEYVQAEIGKLDSSSVQVPDAYTQAEWVAQVKAISSQHADTAEPEAVGGAADDDEEDGF